MKRQPANRGYRALPSGETLIHFTRASTERSALDSLVAILREGVIRGGSRMVRGGGPVVCLFDAPVAELAAMVSHRTRRRYEPFGIAVDKRYAFRMGARPVIYLPWREARELLPADQLWRVVSLDMVRTPPIDWSFEREWRIRGDLALEPERVVALVEGWRDAEEVFARFDGHPPCAGVLPLKETAR